MQHLEILSDHVKSQLTWIKDHSLALLFCIWAVGFVASVILSFLSF